MRKTAIIATLALSFVFISGMVAAAKDKPVKVLVDGVKKDLKPAAFLRGKTVYLPLRATADLVKATIKQEKDKKSFTIASGKKKTTVRASDGVKIKGQLLLPLDLMSKLLECDIKWDKTKKFVSISTKTAKEEPKPKPCTGST